jgi:galactokinase
MPDHQLENIITAYKEIDGGQPIIISAPGRINIIGEHIDYNHGLVLPAAINKRMIFALGKSDNGRVIRLKSLDFAEEMALDLTNLPDSLEGWQGYVIAIIHELQSRNLLSNGFTGVFSSDIPIGAGMSSSAALCCGIISGLNNLFSWQLTNMEIARIAQASEHRLGANVGLMDQFAVMFGRAEQAILLDCLDYSHQYIPLDLIGYSFVLINTKIKHRLVDSAYNERISSCERVLTVLRQHEASITTFRDIKLADLENLQDISEEDIKRAKYVLGENDRVEKTIAALKNNDLVHVGEFMYQSHAGLSKEYEVSCLELDHLVDLTRNESAILGARMMGGGFGGCTINLIKKDMIESTITRIMVSYQQRTQIRAEFHQVSIDDSIKILA